MKSAQNLTIRRIFFFFIMYRSVHQGVKKLNAPKSKRSYRHSCKLCPKLFQSPIDLSTHMRTHSGDKPFSCEHCHRAFSQKGTMYLLFPSSHHRLCTYSIFPITRMKSVSSSQVFELPEYYCL